MLNNVQIALPLGAIGDYCRQNGITRLSLFGSVLRDDFDPGRSDVDFLVRFEGNDAGPWMSKFMDMEEEFGRLLGRKVDVVDWGGIEQSTNPVRRGHILKHARRVYEQG